MEYLPQKLSTDLYELLNFHSDDEDSEQKVVILSQDTALEFKNW